jgi:hypothetical protein
VNPMVRGSVQSATKQDAEPVASPLFSKTSRREVKDDGEIQATICKSDCRSDDEKTNETDKTDRCSQNTDG